jgi:hypothetical protein
MTTLSSQKPRKEKQKMHYSTWKYSTTPRVLRLTLLTKASPGAYNLVFFKFYIAISMDACAYKFRSCIEP